MTYAKTIQSMTAHGSHLFAANDDQQEEETCAGDLSEADIDRLFKELGGDELKALSGNGRNV